MTAADLLFAGLGIGPEDTEDTEGIEDRDGEIEEGQVQAQISSSQRKPGGAVRVQNLPDVWPETKELNPKEPDIGQLDNLHLEMQLDEATESDEKQDEEEFLRLQARPYQVELLKKAMDGNTIVYLGTGSGKTFIAVMLIKEMRGELIAGPKKAVFLVSSVALVAQQRKLVAEQTGLQVVMHNLRPVKMSGKNAISCF